MVRTRSVERSRYRVYWKRALEFRDTMRMAIEREWWSAVGLNAIHCIISAADAVLVYRQRIRTAGQDHLDAAPLLAAERELPDIGRAVGHFRKALAKKNLVAYEDRDLSPRESKELAEHAERFCDWVASHVLPR